MPVYRLGPEPAFPPLRELEASVGIIGAGPAGLAAAEELRRRGYRVDIYDRYDRVSGLLACWFMASRTSSWKRTSWRGVPS